jgi:signal transduction histidine kinase/DNA-binding response OmpR family regulator
MPSPMPIGDYFYRGLGRFFRLRGPASADPNAQLLHNLLLGLVVWLLLHGAVIHPVMGGTTPNTAAYLFAVLIYTAVLLLLNKGFVRSASWTYLVGTWLLWTVVILFNGGIHSNGFVFYVAIPISAAWLFGYRAVLLSGGVCLLTALGMAVVQMSGFWLPKYFPGRPIGIWSALLAAMVIASVPTARVLQNLKEALARSRAAEAALQEQQESLEELVRERTSQLSEALKRTETANRARTVFFANMNHELRTPLNAILGFSAMIATDAGVSEQHRKDLNLIQRSGENLLELIDEVLDMARIESGGVVVETVPLDLHGLLNDTVDMLRERARAKNLGLLLEISAQTPGFIRCDSGKLRQILTNLLGNAVKYTEEGGIVLRADAKPAKPPNDFTVIFDVEDTGIGIAPEDQARIFDPFVQAGKRGSKGTGLGLAICRHFVGLLEGTIQLESTPGQGSRFCVEFPVRMAEASEVMVESAVVRQVIGLEPGQPDYRVLIVEDQEENWLLLERLLRTAGFQVQVATDGRQGVECFEKWRPQFIWMDNRLPVLSGSEATARIRKLEGGAEVKIVAVTASAFGSQREEVLNAGFDDFVRKPYRQQEILDCMARHLGVRYRYGPEQQTAGGDGPAKLRPEDLATLPARLRDELRNAVTTLDAEQISLVAGQISEQDAALGSVLTRLAGKLTYTPILDALERCEKRVLKASS